jgi:hypothetical protein
MMEHQGKKAPQQTLPPTPAQQAAQQIANGDMSQIQQQAQQAEQRAMQTQAIPVTPNNGTPYQPQKQTKPITSTEELAAAMGYTSPEEENRLRKASLMNQRILAVGDALRHIGNIANTVKYAPAQQYNSPVLEEQARYEKGKALRDRANQQYIAYQQAKAKQDAEQKRWEAQFNYNQAKDERNYKFNAAKAAAELAERQRQYDKTFGFNQQKHKDDVEYKNLTAKETARHHRALESTSRAGLAETIRHNKEVEANGGTAKGSFPVKSPYGKMHVPGKSIPQAQMNQAYKDFERAGWIKQDEFKKRMSEMGIGAKADPDYVRNRIVEEVIAENGMASDYMRDNFNWQYEDDSRGTGAMLMNEPQHATGLFSAPWNNNRGNPFEERQQSTNSNNHKSNPFG